MKKRLVGAVAMSTALALTIAACGGDGGDPDDSGGTATAEFDAATGQVFNASDEQGGTLRYAITEDWDSVDPGDTYYGLSWNLLRLYGRTLTMFNPVPGQGSAEVIPDLAESLGEPSDDGRTWTYVLREGLVYEDGTPITSQDVKYAVMRSIHKEVLVNGPTYFGDALALEEGFESPYENPDTDTAAIETPDDRTIVFHLKEPFGGFDFFAQLPQTAPVPQDKDTGIRYRDHVVASGPYMFEEYNEDANFTLVRNPNWDPATDPNRPALPDRIEVTLNVNQDDLDNQILSGDLDVDLAGNGIAAAARTRVINDPALLAQADNPAAPRLWYTSINPHVAPLDNIECRKAILFAADRTSYLTAYGGQYGGDIPTHLLPPQIPGSQEFDLYPAGPDNTGDLEAAQAALDACGQPEGFATKMAFRSDRPAEQQTAEALQQSLGRVGIELELVGYPTGDYFSTYAGDPEFRDSESLGLMTNGWQSDWADGFGFFSQIVDSRTIRPGSSNLSVYLDEVDQLLDQAVAQTDLDAQQAIWAQIDQRVMEEAVILPGVFSKALTVRPQNGTNIFVNEAYGQYDYMMMGVDQG
ncbi:MAG: ABC transporter substrate-binding protein [Micromonosporaceae bacterium]|nr:ABC transporter substrate-binding protein [Micromonosporaceae bacterium]